MVQTRKQRGFRVSHLKGGNPTTGLPPLPAEENNGNEVENITNDYGIPINGTISDVLDWGMNNIIKRLNILPTIQNMIENGADVNEIKDGMPLLHYCMKLMNDAYMASRETSPNNDYRYNPLPGLYYNYFSWLVNIFKILVNSGAEVNSFDNQGATLLIRIVLSNAGLIDFPFYLFEFLVEHGADINLVGRGEYENMTPLTAAIKYSKSIFVKDIDILLSNGSIITANDIIQSLTSQRNLREEIILKLLNLKLSQPTINQLINYVDRDGGNLLHTYVRNIKKSNTSRYYRQIEKNFQKQIIEKLLEIGINPEFRDGLGQTPARLAINMGLNEIAEMLRVHPERSPKNRKARNIYGFNNATMKRLRENQNARRRAAGVGGRRRSTRRRQLRRS